MKHIRVIAFLLTVCLIFSVNVCAAEQNAYPVTLTDAAGREVVLDAPPERVVSGYYISTYLLLVLGQRDKLVGVEAKTASRPIYALAAPEILDLPNVGSAKQFDLEGCVSLEPDLVILPLKLRDAADVLQELGIETLLVNPESEAELMDMLRLLCKALDVSDPGLEAFYAEKQAKLREILDGASVPQVYLAGNSAYLRTAGKNMFQNAMLEAGGGCNVATEIRDAGWAEISYEQLLAWDPEVVLIAAEADYTAEDLLNDPMLQNLEAVRSGRVYAMPSQLEAWDAPVPGAILGSLWTASVLHPDAYPFAEFCADAAEFYRAFYGIEIDEQMLR